jgi:hypothetical protein
VDDTSDNGSDDGSGEGATICSARGCTAPAAWELRWNNPKLHTPERRKVWLACPAHLQSLSDFLAARKFLREVEAVSASSGGEP